MRLFLKLNIHFKWLKFMNSWNLSVTVYLVRCCNRSCPLLTQALLLSDLVKEHFLACNFYKGIDCIVATLHAANRFFESQKPWELCKKDQSPHQNCVLHLTMETLRVCGILLQPIVPELSDTLLRKLGIPKEKRMWKDIRPFSWEQGRLCNIPISGEKIMLYKRIMVSKSWQIWNHLCVIERCMSPST